MNTGLQDAANLAWKLALVIDDAADAALLDSFEAERKPVAQLVADGGDDFEHMQLVADPTERAGRDGALRATFATDASPSRSGRGRRAQHRLCRVTHRRRRS